jgi:hypothetical protein
MKKPYYLILIVLGITLLIFGIFVNRNNPGIQTKQVQTTQLPDIVLGTDGFVEASVTYPSELTLEEEGIITLKVVPDKKVKDALDQGLTIDSQLSANPLKTRSDRRQNMPVQARGTEISWTVSGNLLIPAKVKLSLGLADQGTDPTKYPLSPQHHFEFNIPVVESKSKTTFKQVLGPLMMGFGGAMLIVGFIMASKDFDQAAKPKKKKSKR